MKRTIRVFDDVSGFFAEPPFVPPKPIVWTTNSLVETGYWVISQGKDFFRNTWENPQLFHELVDQDVVSLQPEKNFYGVVETAWESQFPGEDIDE